MKNKEGLEFRELKRNVLETKIKQQYDTAKKIKDTLKDADLSDCEEGFEVAKEMLIDNEKGGIWTMFKDVFGDYLKGGMKWLNISITFFLGIMSTMIIDEKLTGINGKILETVVMFMILGYVVDVASHSFEKNEKLSVKIIKDMSYNRFRFLINSEQNVIDGAEENNMLPDNED